MARTMTPNGTPRPMPILAEALRPLGRGVGEVGCIVERTDTEEADEGEDGRDEVATVGKTGTGAVAVTRIVWEEDGRDEVATVGKTGTGAVAVTRIVWGEASWNVPVVAAGRALVTICVFGAGVSEPGRVLVTISVI